MLEVELKSVLADWNDAVRRAEAAGATLVFAGDLEDRRYDTPDGALEEKDQVVRVRTYRDDRGARTELDWKGATLFEDGYKKREEIGVPVGDALAIESILNRLGYVVTVAIDREIRAYDLLGASIRFERYPRMDLLVEVEGTPEGD